MRYRTFQVIFSSLFLLGLAVGQQKSAAITIEELSAHVKILASDEMEGRRAGTPGADRAASYIADEFKSYGLKPMGKDGSYLQSFEFVSSVKLGTKNQFSFSVAGAKSVPLTVDKSFRPLGFSSNGSFSGEVVFVGYGISFADKKYDDYEGMDVKDKAVLLFRMAPALDSTRGAMDMVSSLRYKASRAKEKGAKAILVVTGPADGETDDLIKLSYDRSAGDAGILSLNLTREAADLLLAPLGTTVKQLQETITSTRAPKSMPLKQLTVAFTEDINTIKATSSNVLGYIEGSDSSLKGEVVVIGAHYDHLGWGGEGSMKPDTQAIHHGADDNASGTAGLLELAQAFSEKRASARRSMLFIAFTGEELGLLGSGQYVKTPVLPLEQTVVMMNMDMVGRLTNKTLIVYGVGTSAGFDSLVRSHNKDSIFVLKLNKDGFGPSDHASFYGKKIPVFHFFTDLHSDYHRPEDTFDRINYPGMQQVVILVQAIAQDIVSTNQRPAYIAVEAPRSGGNPGRSTRVWVGTVPDFGEQTEGMKLSGVREGSPASKAGMKAGDIIIKFGKIDIKNLYDFTYAIGEYKVGDVLDVVVKRGTETLTLSVTLERRPN
jgi:aminopeptidase YwaD